MSSLAGVNHITVLTGDLDRLAAFYEEVFAAPKLVELPVPEPDGPGRHALIGIGGGAVLHLFELGRVALPPARPMFDRGRIDHFALQVTDADALERLRAELLSRGATDGTVTDFGIVRVLTFTDPDGHTVELAHWVGDGDPGELDMSRASDDELIHRRATAAGRGPAPATHLSRNGSTGDFLLVAGEDRYHVARMSHSTYAGSASETRQGASMITHSIEIDCGPEDASERNAGELVRRYFDVVWNHGDLAAVDDFFGDEFTNFGHRGADARALIRAVVAAWRAAFPDLRFDIEDEIVSGDAVIHLLTCSGTHTGRFEHPAVGVLEPSGRSFTVDHMHIHRVRDGHIVQHWGTRNDLAMLQQLGAVTAPQTTGPITSAAGWQRSPRT